MSAAHNSWLFVRLYASRTSHAFERLIADAIPAVLARGLHERWFFVRYADEDGPHVRLRLRPWPGRGDELAAALDAMASEAGARAAFEAYVPELDKFGGPAGMAIAEELFELSSAIAVELVRGEQTAGAPGRALCADLMALVVAAFPPPGIEHRFWSLYARRLGAAAASSLPAAAAAAATTPANAGAVLERWRAGLERCAARYRELATRPPPEVLAAHFLHLMNNRLGVSIAEEAQLAALLAERSAAAAIV
jgi:thiopeptide-type bacteriocin biosynthesis protein